MELLCRYLKQHRLQLLLWLIFCAIFSGAFLLYRLPIGAVIYPSLLCLLIGALFIGVDFSRVRKRHERLQELCNAGAAMIQSLPEPQGTEDADYQAIIEALKSEIAALETSASEKYNDMIEYYTVWVHQIKTPIASMRLTLQNEDSALSRRISSDLFRIEQYVEMVLAFLRLDSTTSDYVFRECDLDRVIRQSVKKFSGEFIGRKIGLVYEPIRKSMVTDEKWLGFVLEQVLSNALKYTREGSICIRFEEPDTICVEDTGIGIAPEDLPRVFEKGYTGYNGREDKKASGIGLYLCRRVCNNLGASISAANAPSGGTVIRIRLEQYRGIKE